MRHLIKQLVIGSNARFAVICGLTAFGIVFERFLPLTTALLIAVYIVGGFWLRIPHRRSPADVFMVVLGIIGGLVIWVSPLKEITVPQVLRLWTGMLFAWAIIDWVQGLPEIEIIETGAAFTGLAFSMLAFLSVRWPIDKLAFLPATVFPKLPVAISDIIHPNVMAGYLVVLLPLPVSALLTSWNTLSRMKIGFFLLVSVFMIVVLVMTQSRGALMSLAVAAAILICLRWKRGWLLMVIAGAISALIIEFTGFSRIAGLFFSSVDGSSSLAGRIEIWSRGIYMIQDFPLTGIGMGLYGPLVDRLYPLFLNEPGSVPHAHNIFIQVAVDLGIPGLVIYLAILILAITAAWRTWKSTRNNRLPAIGMGLLASLAALLTHGLTDAVTWGMVRPAPLIWGILGLALASQNAALQVHNLIRADLK